MKKAILKKDIKGVFDVKKDGKKKKKYNLFGVTQYASPKNTASKINTNYKF